MFKSGDWIIATKTYQYQGGCVDRSYLDCAILVVAVTPHHIVYHHQYSSTAYIMLLDDVVARGFILAEPDIIISSKEHYHWMNNLRFPMTEQTITGWDEW